MSSSTIQIQARITWMVTKTKSSTLVAVCDPLGLTLEADDEAEMRSLIAEAQHCLFLDLFEDGELPKFLMDQGWTPNRPIPAYLPENGVRFDVPFKVEFAPMHGHA